MLDDDGGGQPGQQSRQSLRKAKQRVALKAAAAAAAAAAPAAPATSDTAAAGAAADAPHESDCRLVGRGPAPDWTLADKAAVLRLVPSCGTKASALFQALPMGLKKSRNDVKAFCSYYADELGKLRWPASAGITLFTKAILCFACKPNCAGRGHS
jgi:hypothetical protein